MLFLNSNGDKNDYVRGYRIEKMVGQIRYREFGIVISLLYQINYFLLLKTNSKQKR
jgi:hypothetical protein